MNYLMKISLPVSAATLFEVCIILNQEISEITHVKKLWVWMLV